MATHLPSDREFELLALIVKERTGREIAELYKKRTGKTMPFGTLYTTFRRLVEAGWATARDDEDEDGRLRWFRITGQGARALAAAGEKMRALLRLAAEESRA